MDLTVFFIQILLELREIVLIVVGLNLGSLLQIRAVDIDAVQSMVSLFFRKPWGWGLCNDSAKIKGPLFDGDGIGSHGALLDVLNILIHASGEG